MRPASSGPMPRSCSANTVPCAMTNRLRSLASRVITSWARPSAARRGPAAAERSTNGITAIEARRPRRGRRCRRRQRRGGGFDAGACRSGWPGCAPGVVQRRTVEPFGLEQPHGRGQMLLTFADPAAPRERRQQHLVHALVERRELQPFLQIANASSSGTARRDARAGRRGSRGIAAAAPSASR